MDDSHSSIDIAYDCTEAERAEASAVLTAKGDAKVVATTGSAAQQRAKGLLGWVLFIGLCVALIVILHYERRGKATTPQAAADAAPWPVDVVIALGCFGLSVAGLAVSHVFFRLLRRAQANHLRGKVRYSFAAAAGVTHHRPGRRDTLAWDRFCGFDETANLFVLRYSPTEGLVLPKRLFQLQDVHRLRELLRNKTVRPAIPLSLGFPITHT